MKVMILLWYGHAGPYVMLDFEDAFKALGHEVVTFNMTEVHELTERVGPVEGYKDTVEKIKAFNPDMVVGYGLIPIYVYVMEDHVLNLFESLKIPYVSVIYDNPLESAIFNNAVCALGSDIYFPFCWDKYYVDSMKLLGFNNVNYLPIASNTKRFYKMPENLREMNPYKEEVSFVGAWSKKREVILLSLSKRCKPAIYGYLWDENASERAKALYKKDIDNLTELQQVYNYSNVNLNISMDQGITSLNMRVFDVLACEGFLITDYKPDLETLFDIEKEIVCFRDPEELENLIDYYSRNEKARKDIARLGRRRVLREHTYIRRAEYIIETLKDCGVVA